MTNTDIARLARQWAEDSDPSFMNDQTRAAVEHIMATTVSETLVTEEDYENAPKGTVVDVEDILALHSVNGWLLAGFKGWHSPAFMAATGEGEVLRWGGWDK